MTALAFLVLLAACGGGRPEPTETIDERLDAPEVVSARERAPDMVAAAERARADVAAAESEGNLAAADDHATRARLLLAAAVAESDRIDAEQARLSAESRAAVAEAQVARDHAALAEIEAETRRLLAARFARSEAERVRADAEADEARRYRGSAAERERIHGEAAAFLATRTRLTLAAAVALGVPDADAEAVRDLLDRVPGTRPGGAALSLANDAQRRADRLLARVRAERDAPNADEVRGLVTALREAGFSVEQLDRGLSVAFGTSLGTGAQVGRAGVVKLTRFARVLDAHPHGPVQIEPRGTGAQARGERIAAALVAAGVARERVVVAAARGEEPTVDIVLVAYGPSPRVAPAPAAAPQPK